MFRLKTIIIYRVTKRVRNKEIAAKLHILSTNFLAALVPLSIFYFYTISSKLKDSGRHYYRGIQRVCNESITAKLHILSPNILTGYLKASEVTWISAIHTIFSHPPAHSGPISFSKVENLKLTSGTNKSK